jgi:hypothetical protein
MENFKSLLDSSSAMSRFRTQNGLKVTASTQGSSFILMSKLKRSLKTEVTKEVFDVMKLRYFSPNTEVKRVVFLDRLETKVDGFSNSQLQYCIMVLDEDGVEALVDTLRMPREEIKRLADQMIKAQVDYERNEELNTLAEHMEIEAEIEEEDEDLTDEE